MQLPLLDIVWVNKELVEHTAEVCYVSDLCTAHNT